jgi:Flp pilus assembly protein TadG
VQLLSRKKLGQDQQGATAIEFALIAPVFFAFILGIVDICAYFFVAGQLQHGVIQAAREIRTGNVVGNNTATRDAFRTAVCAEIVSGMVGSCSTSLKVDVRAFNSYGTITLPATLDANGNGVIEDSETSFDTGGASCPVIVRAYYNYSTIIPGLQYLLAGVVPSSTYITAAAAFRNEPFGGGTAATCSFN